MATDSGSRRDFLLALGCGLASRRLAMLGAYESTPTLAPDRTKLDQEPVAAPPSVSERTAASSARSMGVLPHFGSPLTIRETMADDAMYELLRQTSDVFVLAGPIYWSQSEPRPGVFRFDLAEKCLNFARANRMLVRGHPMVYHQSLPPWLPSESTPVDGERILLDHVKTIAMRFRGRVDYWDVVNEPIDVQDGRSDALRNNLWLRCCGPEYIGKALRLVHEVDPAARLGIGEYGVEDDTPASSAKRAALLQLYKVLLRQRVPLHYVAVHGHVRGEQKFSGAKLGAWLREFEMLGVSIVVSELDVDDRRFPAAIEARDRLVADAYSRFLETVLGSCSPVMINTWGLSDRSSWLQEFAPRPDGLPQRSLPFDADLRPKPAWRVLREFGIGREV
jgi:endo-1,4-beta-xylanase